MAPPGVVPLTDVLERAAGHGHPFHESALRSAISHHALGNPLSADRVGQYRTFLQWVVDGEAPYVSDEHRLPAQFALRDLETGQLHRTRPTSAHLLVLEQAGADMEQLVYQPRDALERVYFQAVEAGVGTPEQRMAMARALSHKTLTREEQALALEFLGTLQKIGFKGEGTDLVQARFFVDLHSAIPTGRLKPVIHDPTLLPADWKRVEKLSASPVMNIALLPLGLMEHILAAVVMKELSFEEAWEEVFGSLGTLTGFAVGTTVWEARGLVKMKDFMTNEKLADVFRKVGRLAPEKVRPFIIPAMVMAAFVYLSLRESQNLSEGEEASEYRWNFLKEMAEGFGVELTATGTSYFLIKTLLSKLGKVPKGKIGAAGVLGLATSIGMMAQEIYSGWQRREMRKELKKKTYVELLERLNQLPTYPKAKRDELILEIDRKFSILIGLNILELPSVAEAIKLAEQKRVEKDYAAVGIRMKPYEWMTELTPKEQEAMKEWTTMVKDREWGDNLPVTMLPAQKKRVFDLWKNDLAEVNQFMLDPLPISWEYGEAGEIPPEQFSDWGISQTMSLLFCYSKIRSRLN